MLRLDLIPRMNLIEPQLFLQKSLVIEKYITVVCIIRFLYLNPAIKKYNFYLKFLLDFIYQALSRR